MQLILFYVSIYCSIPGKTLKWRTYKINRSKPIVIDIILYYDILNRILTCYYPTR